MAQDFTLKADIQITTTTSDLQKKIEGIVKGLPGIDVKLKFNKTDIKNQLKNAFKSLSSQDISIKPKISSFDAKTAINNLVKQVNNALANTGTGVGNKKNSTNTNNNKNTNSNAQQTKQYESAINKVNIQLARALELRNKLNKIVVPQYTNKADQAEVNSLNQSLDNLKAKLDALKANPATVDATSLNTVRESINDIVSRIKELQSGGKVLNSIANPTEYEKANSQIEAVIGNLQKLKTEQSAAKSSNKTKDLYAEYDQLIAKLQAYKTQLQQGQIKQKDFNATIAAVKSRMTEVKNGINEAGKGMMAFGDRLKSVAQRFAAYYSINMIVMRTISAIKQLISTAAELDTAMNQLEIVTQRTSASYETFYNNINKTAQAIGASTKDLIESTTVFARLGYSIEESSVLAEYTQMLSGVGDIETSVAQDAITAIIKAFNISADDIESVMDKLVTVGNNFPISVSQLAEGMNNAGSALSSAGNSIEQSLALLAAANTTVQNISKSSTGLRTIAARIRQTKTELDDLGETIETAKHEEVIQALTNYGVSLTTLSGEYRSTYDILQDIAGVWEQISSMEQAAITEELAGTRQQNVFASLIEQFQEASGAMTAMESSQNALTNAYDIRMQSVEAHSQQLQASVESLANAMFNSEQTIPFIDFAKGFIDFLTAVSSFADKLGGIKTLLVGIAGLIVAINVNKITGLIAGVGRLFSNIKLFGSAFAGAMKSGKGFFTSLSQGANAAGVAISVVQVAILGVTAALMGALIAFNLAKQAQNEAIQKAQEAYDSANATYEESNAVLEAYEAYVKLNSIQNRSVEQESEYQQAVSNLNEALGERIVLLAGLQEGSELYNSILGKIVEEENRVARAQSSIALQSATDALQTAMYAWDYAEATQIRAFTNNPTLSPEDTTNTIKIYERLVSELSALDEQIALEISKFGNGSDYGEELSTGRLLRLSIDYADESGNAYPGFGNTTSVENFITRLYVVKKLLTDIAAENKDLLKLDIMQDMQNMWSEFSSMYEQYVGSLYDVERNEFGSITSLNDYLAFQNKFVSNYADMFGADGALEVFQSYASASEDIKQYYAESVQNLESAKLVEEKYKNLASQIANDLDEAYAKTLDRPDAAYNQKRRKRELIKNEEQYIAKLQELSDEEFNAYSSVYEKTKSLEAADLEVKNLNIVKSYKSLLREISITGSDWMSSYANEYNKSVTEITRLAAEQGMTFNRYVFDMSHKYLTDAQSASSQIKDIISELWSSEDFKTSKEQLEEFAATYNGITADNIKEIASESVELQRVLNYNGMSASFLAEVFTQMAYGADGISMITDEQLAFNDALKGTADAMDSVTNAVNAYSEEIKGITEKDENFKAYAEAFAAINEELNSGNTNSNTLWASLRFLFGEDALSSVGYGEGLPQIISWVDELKSVFDDADSSGSNLLNKLYEMSKAGQLLDGNGNSLINITEGEDGAFDIFIPEENYDALSEKLGITRDAFLACVEAWGMFSNVDYSNLSEIALALDQIGASAYNASGQQIINQQALESYMESAGSTEQDIERIIQRFNKLDNVTLLDINADANTLLTTLEGLKYVTRNGNIINIDAESLSSALSMMGLMKEEAAGLFNGLSKIDGVHLTNAAGELIGIQGALEGLDELKWQSIVTGIEEVDDTTTENLDNELTDIQQQVYNVSGAIEVLQTRLDELTGKEYPKIVIKEEHVITTKQQGSYQMNAKGTKNAKKGLSLVGEEGAELVQTSKGAYITGSDGPEFTTLNSGDVVYTADETEDIINRSRLEGGLIPTFKAGTKKNVSYGTFTHGTSYFTTKPGITVSTKSTKSTKTSSSSSSKSSSSSSSSTDTSTTDTESAFARAYKDHNHLVAMNKETDAEYLKWLEGAYKEAYAKGEITLDEFYKYEEEVYQKSKDLFMDTLGDLEFNIEMKSHDSDSAAEIIKLYESGMATIEKKLAELYAQGLTDNDEEIQELKQRWWKYYDARQDILDDAKDKAKDTTDELVKYRVDMLKQDLENQKDALKKQLDNLKEFYDKQKKLLNDQYDEDKYLEDQAEKRKKISDIQAQLDQLALDNSAKAQKKRLELQEELADAEKDLYDLERDRAKDIAEEQLDNAYAAQEAAINTEIDNIDAQLNDAKALYDQALADVKKGSIDLYNEMIAYNNQYGDGISQTITDKWNEAAEALKNYKSLYGKNYEGFKIPTVTSKDEVKTSGTTTLNNNVAKEQSKAQQTQQNQNTGGSGGGGTTTTSYPYGKASDTTGVIKKGAKGDAVRAIQYALNQLGFGNSGTSSLDGSFGANTKTAVQNFQSSQGIAADGQVGDNTRKKFSNLGYALGTTNALSGIHRINEYGDELIFESSDGNKYRMFSGGEKVLNANATSFLYDFALSKGSIMTDMMSDALRSIMLAGGMSNNSVNNIKMGDIIINGDASDKTVSQIRREQRDGMDYLLSELSRLKKS